MAKSTKYNIIPDIRLLVDIGSANYTVPEAISELVANSMDARNAEDSMEVEVGISPEAISIVDNGNGMRENVLGEALRLSAQMDQVTGNTETRKGMYGLGLKAACSSLGRLWQIVTRPPGDPNQYSVEVDLEQWLQQSDRHAWEVEVTAAPYDPQGPLSDRPHGTSIVVMRLRENFTMSTAVSEKLGMAYKPHLEMGDQIEVNGKPVFAKEYNLLEGRRWEVDIPVGDMRIKGWVGLDSKTHNDGLYGINIYRLGQLVEAWNKDFLRSHLMSSRVVGEIELPFVNANFHKLGFYKGSEEWKQVKAAMTDFLKPVVKASGDMAKNKNDDLRQAKAIKGLDNALGIVTSSLGQPTSFKSSGSSGGGSEQDSSSRATSGERFVGGGLENLDLEGESFTLGYSLRELEDDTIPWDYVYDAKTKDLQAIINTKSRIYERVDEEEFIGALALSEAVVGFLINQRGFDYGKAQEIRNRWLYLALRIEVASGPKG